MAGILVKGYPGKATMPRIANMTDCSEQSYDLTKELLTGVVMSFCIMKKDCNGVASCCWGCEALNGSCSNSSHLNCKVPEESETVWLYTLEVC
jgi:hypothetical protein